MNKNAFLSYSHDDRDFAERIAIELRKKGIEVWLDKWEIKAGDSLIQKIFFEGLSNCDIFLILLSNASVKSKWVKEELETTMIKRIEGVTRIIPLIKEKCEIPFPLRPLLWVDLSEDFDDGIHKIVKSVYNVSEKPPLGKTPEYITELRNSVGDLSRIASSVGSILISHHNEILGREKSFTGKDLQSIFPNLRVEDINDAVDELEEYGLVKTNKYPGTAPYDFGSIEPIYTTFIHFMNEGLDYNPVEDIKTVASAVASKGQIDGKNLQELTKLPALRLNRAVAYLENNGIINNFIFSGTAPFNFGTLEAIRKTRQFVSNNCKY